MIMQGLVYILCAGTALASALLLMRGFLQNRTRLLLWCSLFFCGLFLENLVLFVDRVTGPEIDLTSIYSAIALVGVSLLLYGLVFDAE